MDATLVVLASPIAVAVCLALWALCALTPRRVSAWQAPVWLALGCLIGYGASIIFFRCMYPTMRVSPLDWGGISGFVAFGVAFLYRYRRLSVT